MRQAASRYRNSDRYQPMSRLFFDGVEYLLGSTAKDLASLHNVGIRNEIHSSVEGLSVRHLLFSNRQDRCFLWLTPTPETAFTDGRTMQRFIEVEEAIRQYSTRILQRHSDLPAIVTTTKFDFAADG